MLRGVHGTGGCNEFSVRSAQRGLPKSGTAACPSVPEVEVGLRVFGLYGG